MNKAISIFAFLAGAAIGSVVTWKLVKNKYEQIAQEEIDSVKAEFSKDREKPVKKAIEKAEAQEKQKDEEPNERKEHEELVNDLHYTSQSEDVKKQHVKNKDIYVIAPEILGDCDYDIVSLTYYDDGVLTYDDGTVIKNVDELVGSESLKHIGEFEDDAVHVRNNLNKIDYEILADSRKYSDVFSRTARPAHESQ